MPNRLDFMVRNKEDLVNAVKEIGFLPFFANSLTGFSMQGLISVYLMDRGYSASKVSLVVSASLAASVALRPVVGFLSDRFDKWVVCGGLLAINGILGYVFPMLTAFPLMAAVYSMVIAGMNGTNPVVEQMATVSRFPYLLTKVASPVVGAAKFHHIEGAVKAVELQLSHEETAYLEELYAPHNLVGVMAQNTAASVGQKHAWSIGNQKL